MNDLIIEKTYSTPFIQFNTQNGVMKIEGRSIPENPSLFYDPIIAWLNDFFQNSIIKIKLDIKLDYINSGSTKSILSILKTIKQHFDKGIECQVNWYYEEDDESIRDLGKHYKSVIKLPINLSEII
jgi:hypothetical protein